MRMKFWSLSVMSQLIQTKSVLGSIPLSPGGPYDTSGGPKEGVLNVHLVAHTHDDVGWLKTVEELYHGDKNGIQQSSVHNILDSMLEALGADGNRKFIYVELAFFSRWWRTLVPTKRAQVVKFLRSGQLEFINGGWVSNDEAATSFLDIIDQHTLGASFIANEFGLEYVPRVGWQLDPFGHSMFQARAFSLMGMDAWYFGRSDSQDFARRSAKRELETIHSGILAGSMDGYFPPEGFDWDFLSVDDRLNDDDWLGAVNVEAKTLEFIEISIKKATLYNAPDEQTQHVMFTMGGDFQYSQAAEWYRNLDMLIHYSKFFSGSKKVNVFYSTPSMYTRARAEQRNRQWVDKSNYDWFPYCDGEAVADPVTGDIVQVLKSHSYWTGYYSSRPLLKRAVRVASSVLSLGRLAELFDEDRTAGISSAVFRLWDALSVAQHHDAVTGTAKRAVADDYMRKLDLAMTDCLGYAKNILKSRLPENVFFHPIQQRRDSKQMQSSPTGVPIQVQFGYYESSSGADQPSGAYIFRPACAEGAVAACRPKEMRTGGDTPFSIRVEDTIEGFSYAIHWSVGPIPAGREVVLLVSHGDIRNGGKFYTDSNGFLWVPRELNKRSSWNLVVTDPVAGNYYPVNAGIVIGDAKNSMMVVPDRAVGGSSLEEGQIEIMVHRRTALDDNRGMAEPLDERDAQGEGIVVNGVTNVFLTNTVQKTDKGLSVDVPLDAPLEVPLDVPLEVPFDVPVWALRPPVALGDVSSSNAKIFPNDFLKLPIPDSVILTHVHWQPLRGVCEDKNTLCMLVRFMNLDRHRETTMDMSLWAAESVFSKSLTNITQVTLSGAVPKAYSDERKIFWSYQDTFDSIEDDSSPPSGGNILTIPAGGIGTYILELRANIFKEPIVEVITE